MTGEGNSTKVGEIVGDAGGGGFAQYRAFCYGDAPWYRALYAEFVTTLIGSLSGAAGLWLRSKLYRPLFAAVGDGAVFGRNLTLRHAHKIRVGARTIVDDGVVLDAKGEHNRGITLGDRVFLGRNTILYCKEGDIEIGEGASISSNCQIVSALRVAVGAQTVVGSYSYFLSGGRYDAASAIPFARQDGQHQKAPLSIGRNCWIGAHVTVMEGADVGEHCVIGAGAVVTEPVPGNSVAVGIPARVLRTL